MPERSDRHGWIDLLVPDGPFLSVAALDVQTVGENWPTRLSAEQRSLLMAPPASEAEQGEGWDDSSWDGRRARVTELLTELLGYREGKTLAVAPGVSAHHHIYRARVSADFVIHAPGDPDDVRMVVICGPDAIDDPSRLDPARTHTHDGWVSTPVQRAALLARHADADLALVTNGHEHLLVNVVTGTTGSAMWTVNGLEDRHARDAFVALLHKQRVLHRIAPLSKLIELSQDRQKELTDTLGKQVRRAAEALVNAISRANRTSRGRLLEGVSGQQVYAATTRVLMRTVFLLVAEERGLLPVAENQLFADQYAMSTLLDKLDEDAYRNRSAMERRAGTWQRMMALSRAVHSGIEHDDLRLPAYGGNLFDPDGHPFLEARITAADGEGFEQLDVGVVDDFTVLTVLRHLQIADGQRISFRSLDVEQIGHVYEALLDHSAVIVPEDQFAVLGLIGKAGDEPEVSLIELEAWTAKSHEELGKQLVDLGVAAEARSVYKAIDDGLAPDSDVAQTLNVAVANNPGLRERVERYAPLLRTDARGVALVFRPGDVYVTETSSKRDSGTAYTPRSLAEEIAKHALDPLIYDPGPQNEPDESKWKLKAPDEILDLKVCDPAVGSAAILVAAVRYLAEALLQARVEAGELAPDALASGAMDVESVDARVQARRAIVSRCIYGVDRDPMAVEMAKLSLWLITMARDEPFSFLDHAIRHGDSLLGITSLDQLRRLHLDEETDLFGFDGGGLLADESVYAWRASIDEVIARAARLRRQLRDVQVKDVGDAREQARLHHAARRAADSLRVVADAITAACLSTARQEDGAAGRILAGLSSRIDNLEDARVVASLADEASARSERGNPNRHLRRVFLHWPLEFPEVWDSGRSGFDAVMGNPPFLGGTKISGPMGSDFRQHIARYVAQAKTDRADLVSFFFRRAVAVSAGTVGFISTKSVADSASSRVALAEPVGRGWTIARAVPQREWPGEQAVFVAMVWLFKGKWLGAPWLDGEPVSAISPRLTAQGVGVSGQPFKLKSVSELALVGPKPNGDGFLVEPGDLPEEVHDGEMAVLPFWTAADLLDGARPAPSRTCVFFRDWTVERAKQFPEAFRHVESAIRPSREEAGGRLAQKWWQFGRPAMRIWKATRDLDEIVVVPETSKTMLPLRMRNVGVFNNSIIIVSDNSWSLYGLLTSSVHWWWAITHGTALENRPRYKPSAVFATFPRPTMGLDAVSDAARRLQSVQSSLRSECRGFTEAYNRYNDPVDGEAVVEELRSAHRELDDAVLKAYVLSDQHHAWGDLDPAWDFLDCGGLGVRYTLSRQVRGTMMTWLLELNFRRYAEENGLTYGQVLKETGNA